MNRSETLRVGVVQMASSPSWDSNLARVGEWLAGLRGRCDLIVFPENALCLGCGSTIRDVGVTEDEFVARFGPVRTEAEGVVVLGGVPIQMGSERLVRNASIVVGGTGGVVARYDKMHLFRLREPGTCVDETTTYVPGETPVSFECLGWSVGLSICYDLRFPELFRHYVPIDMIVCTAAFTYATGEAHWKVLLRARAIENQCYVIAAGQCGINAETEVRQYGHSMVVDPWGRVLTELEEEEGAFVVTLERERIRDARRRLPAVESLRL